MYPIFSIIIPLIIGIAIAYLIARIGRKKHIGFWWSFYFCLLNPIIGLLLAFISGKKSTPSVEKSAVWKPVTLMVGMYGLLLLYGSATTKRVVDETQIEVQTIIENPLNTGNKEIDQFLFDLSNRLGAVLGGGILPVTIYSGHYADEYESKKFYRLYSGIILLSLSFYFLLTTRFSPIKSPTKKVVKNTGFTRFDEDANFQKFSAIDQIEDAEIGYDKPSKTLIDSIVDVYNSTTGKAINIRCGVISFVISFLLGWIYKEPNKEFLDELIGASSEWKAKMAIEYYRKESSFFSTEMFDFNWTLFIASFLIIFLVMKVFQDKSFRERLVKKLALKED